MPNIERRETPTYFEFLRSPGAFKGLTVDETVTGDDGIARVVTRQRTDAELELDHRAYVAWWSAMRPAI